MINNSGGELEFVLYVQAEGGSQVLAAGVLEAAIEVRAKERKRKEEREEREARKEGEKGSREKSERRGVE